LIGNDQVDFFELSFEEIKGWFILGNQEDSVILNKASIERGMFMTTAYKVLVFEEKKKTNCSYEKIEIPPLKSQNKTMNYSKLGKDGIVKKGVPVYKGDIIIGKTLTKVQKEDEEKVDCSLAISSGEEGVIDDIWKGVCEEGYVMIKVKIRQLRFPEVGDKVASRSSQKGVCGLLLPQEDMPFTSQGIIPDLLMNPHSYPSRMTLSQLMECLYSKVGSLDGIFGDATPFTDQSIDPVEGIANMLKKHGFQKYGNERLFNGFTGEFLDSEIFIGPTYYQRLKHMVQDKIHCLTLDHEVLTLYGWKMIGEITTNDKVATLNKSGELEYQNPLNIYDYPDYEGSMYSIKNKKVDLLVTGNHRMWASYDGEKYDFIMAKDVFCKNVVYKNDAFLIGKEAYPVDNELLIGLGIWITYKLKDDNKIISLPKELKNIFLYCLDKLKIEYKYDKKKEVFEIDEKQEKESFNLKNLLPQWVFELNENQSKLLIHIIFNNKNIYYTKSKELSDQIQQLCLHAGFSCIIMKKERDELYRLDKSMLDNDDSEETFLNHKKIHVACIEVPNQIFYVRRNGKSVWTGNSRATGNVTMMHHQPSEGRSREGGLRVGEMERDALISHGGAAFIQETLFDMSDQYQVNVCEICGNILSSSIACRICKNGQVNRTNIPYCAKLLFQELEAMGIKIQINTK
jgi:hypothetical protein